MKTLVFALVFMLVPLMALSEQLCGPQDYDSQTPPNFECVGPEEEVMVPHLNPPASVPVHQGGNVVAAWDGALVHRDRLLELGLRIEGIRRLRWADRLHLQSEYSVEIEYANQVCTARVQLVEGQRDSYREQLLAAEERVTRAQSWYRSWWFGAIVGVVATAALVALTAYALHAVN